MWTVAVLAHCEPRRVKAASTVAPAAPHGAGDAANDISYASNSCDDIVALKTACVRAKPEIVKPEQAHQPGKLADCLIP